MDRAAAVVIVQRGLSYTTARGDAIIAALQQAQADLETGKTLPWFLRSEDYHFTGTLNVAYIALPTGWLRFDENEPLAYHTAATLASWSHDLEKGEYDQLRKLNADSTLTEPWAFALRKSTIHVFPTPTAAWHLYGTVYLADDVLSTNIENDWLLNIPYLLIAKAGLLVAADTQDDKAIAKFQALEVRWSATFMAKMVDRDVQTQTYAMGSSN